MKRTFCTACDGDYDYPMLVSREPRALCAHFCHKQFMDFAFHGRKHVRKAALAGFATGIFLALAVAVYLLRCPQ